FSSTMARSSGPPPLGRSAGLVLELYAGFAQLAAQRIGAGKVAGLLGLGPFGNERLYGVVVQAAALRRPQIARRRMQIGGRVGLQQPQQAAQSLEPAGYCARTAAIGLR